MERALMPALTAYLEATSPNASAGCEELNVLVRAFLAWEAARA
jgi:hypothetical protein